MPASEETGSGPIIHDNRRIDPVTGQVRGKHAASKPPAPQVPAGRRLRNRRDRSGRSGRRDRRDRRDRPFRGRLRRR